MNVSRCYHGSCAAANYVYVAGGQMGDKPIVYLQSIERINMNAIDDGWEELPVSSSENFSPRSHVFMAGLSCNELVIIGGKEKRGNRGDGYILDIPNMHLNPVIKNTRESIKFAAFAN